MRFHNLAAEDLDELAHLMPRAATELVRVVGVADALAMLNRMPGVTFKVPKSVRPNIHVQRRIQSLRAVISEAGLLSLMRQAGCCVVVVPTCHQMRVEKRNRWLRRRFDELTSARGGALSRANAVYALGIELASDEGECMSCGGIEYAIDSTGPENVSPRRNQLSNTGK